MNKETIFFSIKLNTHNGHLANSLHLVNVLSEKYNIILVTIDNVNVDVNKYLNKNTKKSIIKIFNINQYDELRQDEYITIDIDNVSDYNLQNIKILQNLQSEYSINRALISENNNEYTFMIFKQILKIDNTSLFITKCFIEEQNLRNFVKFVNNNNIKVYSNNINISNLFSNYYNIGIFYDYKSLLDKNNDYFSKRDNISKRNGNLHIGFFNYIDHSENGLWSFLDNTSYEEKIHINIFGKAPKHWDNYEKSFIKENMKSLESNTTFWGWRDNIKYQMQSVDLVIDCTSDNVLKISNSIIESLILGTKVYTIDQKTFKLVKKYGVKIIDYERLCKQSLKFKLGYSRVKINKSLLIKDIDKNLNNFLVEFGG